MGRPARIGCRAAVLGGRRLAAVGWRWESLAYSALARVPVVGSARGLLRWIARRGGPAPVGWAWLPGRGGAGEAPGRGGLAPGEFGLLGPSSGTAGPIGSGFEAVCGGKAACPGRGASKPRPGGLDPAK